MKFDQLKEFQIPAAEEKILKFWEENKIFEKSLALAKDKPQFVFYEGPPTANGRPGTHHVLARTIKDAVCRYKTMQGFRVDRKGGWDTHGLPVEIEVEKALNLDSKPKIIEYGVANFNQKCRESVFKYLVDWNEITRRIGYWIDLDNAYITLTSEYIETVWWILKNYFDRGLIYQGYKTVPFCPRCETGLSSHEVAQGYEEVSDPSVFVKVKAADGDFSYLVWTTTPWTLPSNAALCMRPDADYALVNYKGEKLVLAASLIEKVLEPGVEIIETKKGRDYEKRKYIPLFDTFKKESDQAFYVLNGDFVTLEDGTGIVHIAPGYGADDFEIGQKYGLPVLQAVAADGHFKADSGKYAGKFIKDADPQIIEDLKAEGKLLKKESYIHNYPFCWRCDSPLIYISRQCWYIRTTQFKKELIKNNNLINWQPDEIRVGRMLDWLENNVDWALSRERFWGTPLPIWICTKCEHKTAVGSVAQLRQQMINSPDLSDLHKPMIDEVKLKCEKCGGAMERVPEVIDTWFDSGAMPYAQWHYPFENKEVFESKYPAEFISEAIDQTRGWFYSLLAISTILFDKPPFKNVIVMEMVLDANGKKMSKHKGNVVDPFKIVYQYGADPLRWYLLNNSNPWLPTKFNEDDLAEGIRKFFDTLKNSVSFLALYANIDDIAARAEKAGSVEKLLAGLAGDQERIDKWVVSRYNALVKNVIEKLDKYDLTPPTRLLSEFVIDDLSNWYIRLNRRRFWAPGDDPSKMRAYLTLYSLLKGVCGLVAPYCPFTAEYLWQELTAPEKKSRPASIHMTTFPTYDEKLIDAEINESMLLAQKIVSLGRAARNRKNLKVRQPLAKIMVSLPAGGGLEKLKEEIELIKDELNIKAVEKLENPAEAVSFKAKLNFAKAGPRLGAKVKEAAAAIGKLGDRDLMNFESSGKLLLHLGTETVELSSEELEVQRFEKGGLAVESDGSLTVAIDTAIDDNLRDEGFAREVVNKVQNMRKTSGFEVTDRINILIATEEPLVSAMRRHQAFVCHETLADGLVLLEKMPADNGSQEWNINGIRADIAVKKV